MLNSGKKIHASRDQKKKKILTLVLSEKKFLNETKNHTPPCKLNGRSLRSIDFTSVSTIFRLDFGIVPTVVLFSFSFHFIITLKITDVAKTLNWRWKNWNVIMPLMVPVLYLLFLHSVKTTDSKMKS